MKVNWDLTHLFDSKEKWEDEVNHLKKEVEKWQTMLDKTLNNEEEFLESLNQKLKVDSLIEQIYCYPKRFVDLNNQSEEHQKMVSVAWNIYETILKLTEKFLDIIKDQDLFLKKFTQKYPEHKRYIENLLRNANFKMNSSIEVLKDIYRTLTEIDMVFGDIHDEEGKLIPLTRKNYNELMTSKVDKVRKEAMEKRNQAYEKLNNTLSLLLYKKYEAEIKEMRTSNFSFLDQKLSKMELPSNIISNLIQTTNERLEIAMKYTNLKKELLGKNEFHIYDTCLPIGLISKMEFELEDAIKEIKNALSILGKDYCKRIDIAFEEGWLDIYPSKYKRKTSFSCISYFGVPYASLNYNKSFVSVRTLAHELGHSIHTSYAKENPFEYFEYSLFTSEIVSKVNEILLNEYILEKDISKDEKIYLLNNVISSLSNTLFGQTMLTEFEYVLIKEIEQGNVVNAKHMNETYQKLFQKYYQDTIIVDINNSCDWSKIPHFFLNEALYLYQYAIGVSLAMEIVRKLKTETNFVSKYIEFLKLGNRCNITDALKTLNIDMTSKEYLETAFRYLDSKIDDLQKLVKEK